METKPVNYMFSHVYEVINNELVEIETFRPQENDVFYTGDYERGKLNTEELDCLRIYRNNSLKAVIFGTIDEIDRYLENELEI